MKYNMKQRLLSCLTMCMNDFCMFNTILTTIKSKWSVWNQSKQTSFCNIEFAIRTLKAQLLCSHYATPFPHNQENPQIMKVNVFWNFKHFFTYNYLSHIAKCCVMTFLHDLIPASLQAAYIDDQLVLINIEYSVYIDCKWKGNYKPWNLTFLISNHTFLYA